MSISKYIHSLLNTFFAPFFELNIETILNARKKTGIVHIFEKPKSSSASFKIQRSSEVYASARGVRTSPCPWPSAGPESPNWPRTRRVFLSCAGHVVMVTGLDAHSEAVVLWAEADPEFKHGYDIAHSTLVIQEAILEVRLLTFYWDINH